MEMSKDGLKLMVKMCKMESGNCIKCSISDICLKVCGGSSPERILNKTKRENN